MDEERGSTDFGFEDVPVNEKSARVREVFASVAPGYDLMNDLMSFGVHRLWKNHALAMLRPRPGDRLLDLAGGSGDLARRLVPRTGERGHVVLADINAAMLRVGRDRLIDEGHASSVTCVQADAEALPFADGCFDGVVIAFGLRNVTDKAAALRSMLRVLKPGCAAVILEFSHVVLPHLKVLYDYYSFQVIPRIGALVLGDADSYRYLVESIRRHPDQQRLAEMMSETGFERVEVHNLSGGIVAVHRGYRL